MSMFLKCKTCSLEFKAGIQMDKESFKSAQLKANVEQCPQGHQNKYNKVDYIFK